MLSLKLGKIIQSLQNCLRDWHSRLKIVTDSVQNLGFELEHLRTIIAEKDAALETMGEVVTALTSELHDKSNLAQEIASSKDTYRIAENTICMECEQLPDRCGESSFTHSKCYGMRLFSAQEWIDRNPPKQDCCPNCRREGVTETCLRCGWDKTQGKVNFAKTPPLEAIKRAKGAIEADGTYLKGETEVEKATMASLASLSWLLDWVSWAHGELEKLDRYTVVESRVRSTGDTISTKEVVKLQEQIDELKASKKPKVDTGNCLSCGHFIPNAAGGHCKLGNNTKCSMCCYHTLAALNKPEFEKEFVYQIVDKDNLPVLGCVFNSEEAAKAIEWHPHWAGITPLEIKRK